MAKTKLNSKKSQKNKQSKIRRTLTWFKPTTPAKGMLLFVMVFSIMGGSYMAYKSFALTWSQGPSSFQLVFGYWHNGDKNQGVEDTHKVGGGCQTNKSCPYVTQLFAASRLKTTIYTNFSKYMQPFFCVTARAPFLNSTKTGTNYNFNTIVRGSPSYTAVDSSFYAEQSYQYGRACHRMSVPEGGQFVDITVTAQPNNTTTSYNLYIASIDLDTQGL